MAANNASHLTPVMIVTRPAAQGRSFAKAVQTRWDGPLDVLQSPLLQIVQITVNRPTADALILTSAHGVNSAKSMGWPAGMRAWCVGAKTANLARAAGFEAVSGPGDAAGLLRLIIAERPSGKLLHLRGRHSRGAIAENLAEAGLQCDALVTYEQQARPLIPEARSAVMGPAPVIFPLFSPRTATILSSAAPFAAPVHIVALSAAVQSAMVVPSFASRSIAVRPTGAAMIDATLACLLAQSRGSDTAPLA